ncbi:hypothetical protein D3C85_1459320 [compost metagenome]
MRPMPSKAMSALQRMVTRTSGTITQSTARHERKLSQHSSVMAAKIEASICTSACSTASLVAAATPALPPPSLKWMLGVRSSAMNLSTSPVTCFKVAP